MLFVNCVLNYIIQLKYLTGFYIAGIHFAMCLKFFSFGHVMYEIHKVLKAMKKNTFKDEYGPNDINETVFLLELKNHSKT